MSGHSKWATIKHRKGAVDAKRGKLFGRLIRAIEVAARDGGGDVKGNPTLATMVQKARDASVPMETIERAIKRGGGSGDGTTLEEITYEGYGPGGVAILVEAMTDNRNRTVAEVRNAFKGGGGTLGESGSVAWQFDNRGIISIEPSGADPDELALMALDAGADDVRVDDGTVDVYTDPAQLERVRQSLEQQSLRVSSAETEMVPKMTVELEAKDAAAVLKLMERLEELDDVQRVYSNVELSEEAIEAFAAR